MKLIPNLFLNYVELYSEWYSPLDQRERGEASFSLLFFTTLESEGQGI